jgi:membrane associated rhomboid family serine protease
MITNLLILLSVAFSFYAWFTQNNLAFSEYALMHGNYHTVLTGLFVHVNPVHLAVNMLFLYIFGNGLEYEVGDKRTGYVFIIGGILSFILSIPVYPGAQMVGASAAIFSVMAALLLIRRPKLSTSFLSPTGPLIIVFFIFNIVAIQTGEAGNVAYFSHVLGFIIGVFFGASWNKKWKESLLYTLLLLAIYIVLYNYLRTQLGWL